MYRLDTSSVACGQTVHYISVARVKPLKWPCACAAKADCKNMQTKRTHALLEASKGQLTVGLL